MRTAESFPALGVKAPSETESQSPLTGVVVLGL